MAELRYHLTKQWVKVRGAVNRVLYTHHRPTSTGGLMTDELHWPVTLGGEPHRVEVEGDEVWVVRGDGLSLRFSVNLREAEALSTALLMAVAQMREGDDD